MIGIALALTLASAPSEQHTCADLVVIGRIVDDEWLEVIGINAVFLTKLEVERVVRGDPRTLSVKGTSLRHTGFPRDRHWLFALRQEGGVAAIVQAISGSTAAEAERTWREAPVPAC